jgi:hypothetical protein
MDVELWDVIDCQFNFSRPSIDAVRPRIHALGEKDSSFSFNGAQAVSAQLQLVSSPISLEIVILHLFNVSSTWSA